MKIIKCLTFIVTFSSCMALCHAASPWADDFIAHRHWITPAYVNSFALGIAIILIMIVASVVWTQKSDNFFRRISHYLSLNVWLGLCFCGVILAIPIGLVMSVVWQILWFYATMPFIFALIIYPVIISSGRIRRILLRPNAVKAEMVFAVAAIMASLLFIILAQSELLPGLDRYYYRHEYRETLTIGLLTHPIDSMKEIWRLPTIFMVETLISWIMACVGIFCRISWKDWKLKRHHS